MTQELDQFKVFREFDFTDPNGVRCDFYGANGPIASVYCRYLTSVISAEIYLAGNLIEDYPAVGG
jgi:hypothetical protein